jgi:hypothetical protein
MSAIHARMILPAYSLPDAAYPDAILIFDCDWAILPCYGGEAPITGAHHRIPQTYSLRHIINVKLLVASGTAEDTVLAVLGTLIAMTRWGLGLHNSANGDLAGWLGDLAPRGDLTSSQLLYRLSGVYKAIVELDLEAHGLHGFTGNTTLQLSELAFVQTRLLPLLALVYETIPAPAAAPDAQPSASSPHLTSSMTCGQQGRTGEGQVTAGDVSSSSSSDVRNPLPQQLGSSQQKTATASHATAAQQKLVTALALSPRFLADVVIHFKANQRFTETWRCVYRHIHQRLQALSCVGGMAFPIRQALSYVETVLHGTTTEVFDSMIRNTTISLEEEPLASLILNKEGSVWKDAWAGRYRPREQAVHAHLLDEYVRAAAERATQQQPSLAEGFRAIMEQS